MDKIYITEYNCFTPLGKTTEENFNALKLNQSGITKIEALGNQKNFYASVIDAEQYNISNVNYSRIEEIIKICIEPVLEKISISDKTLFILSTTKGDITKLKDSSTCSQAALSLLAQNIADYIGISIKPVILSNACVSGVMAIAVAKRMMQFGAYDNAIVVAADEVSEFVVSGFNSFQALSETPCKPYDKNRTGVTLGEGAAIAYLTKEIPNSKVYFEVCGDGIINDANHISGPSRTGEGLHLSIESALKEAVIQASQIDFISAHGTATLYNDEMESIAFTRSNIQHADINSLKGYYGHTLGLSGLLETIVSMESIKNGMLIKSLGCEEIGVSNPLNILTENKEKEVEYFIKTASGFGGCNTAVIFKKVN